ncbi:MAG: hypothetical protein WB245_12385 [Acidimicrobiia bacterium]
MSEHVAETADGRMARAIVKGALVGLPVTLVVLSVGIWLITDIGLGRAITTALLPGVMLGVFGGGFAGMASTMGEE